MKVVFYSHFRGHSALGSSSVPFRSWISRRSECNVLSSLVEEAEGCGGSSFQRGKPGLYHLACWLFVFFFFFYFIFKLYNIVLVLPNIEIILLFDILASILGFLKLPGGLLVE